MTSPTQARLRLSSDLRRMAFLSAVADLAPEVLQSLHRDVYPAFEGMFTFSSALHPALLDSGGHPYPIHRAGVTSGWAVIKWRSGTEEKRELDRNCPSWLGEFGAEPAEAERALFRTKALEWSSQTKLDEDWIRDQVITTLLSWLQSPDCPPTEWAFRSEWGILANDLPPRFTIDVQWMGEDWNRFKNRILKSVKPYWATINRYREQVGWDATISDNPSSPHHHEWLVLYQCKMFSPRAIVKWHETKHGDTFGESAILRAISELAKALGLRRRAGVRGKPSGRPGRRKI